MARLIREYPKRPQIALDGIWDFAPLTRRPARPPEPGRLRERLPVPGVWEMSVRHFRHRGWGGYAREFEVGGTRPASLRLVFEAVSHTADVWLDNQYLGSHYGAYTAFEFICRDVAPGTHRVTVAVDNSFGPHHPLMAQHQDIFVYGGIARSVWAEVLPDAYIASAAALPARTPKGWELACEAKVQAGGDVILPTVADVFLDGRKLGSLAVDRKGVARGRLAVPKPDLWSPESPRLYHVRIAAGGDEWQERVGFRTVAVRGRDILLNGAPLRLRGVNRHEFHPDFGPALPAAVQLKDIEVLRKLGANFVRGSHYPYDPFFLDLCDENGILFWEELSHWQSTAEMMADETFRRESLKQADEMITQHRHHPSIILWGMLNEAHTHQPVARETIGLFARRFRELDPSRLVTYASCLPEKDVAFDLVDVVSVNKYPGWYMGGLEDLDQQLKGIFATVRRRSHGKPVIFSEFGAAAITGVRSFELRKWTEDYQAELLCRVIDATERTGFVTGVAIWQYCDVRTSETMWGTRAREYNNKGIVTAYREPKASFSAVAARFHAPWGGRRD